MFEEIVANGTACKRVWKTGFAEKRTGPMGTLET